MLKMSKPTTIIRQSTCCFENDALVEYAVAGMDNQLFVSRYQVALPDKNQIAAFIDSQLAAEAQLEKPQ